MRLKKIELIGFKSFADKTVIEFHEGITGIVGPNGCGKSNISDAFRWVLGEQSAKSMRGNKMFDVIFAGTNKRKPLNYAEVTLALTDIERSLPTEYEEVSVTRRVHRSGESEYFINRRPVRLKDVHDLFLDSGIGKSAFSIFEQGKIDQVINFSPLERRYIFEEASGILRFLQRKREALRKLGHTEANIERVKDIHAEVERQIIVLEQQAEKARQYKDNKGNLEYLELALFTAKWESLTKRIENTKSRESEKLEQIESANTQIHTFESELHEAKKRLTEGQLELQTRREEVYRRRSEKEIKSKEWQANQERLKEIIAKEKQWLQELEEMIEKRKLRQIEAEQTEKQLETLEGELKELEEKRQGQKEKVSTLEEEVNRMRSLQRGSHQEVVQLLQIENESESELKQNTLRLEHNHDRKQHLTERKERFVQQTAESSKQVSLQQDIVDRYSHSVEEQKSSVATLDREIKETQSRIDETKKKLDTHTREIAESKARQKVLLRIREQMEGFSSGSKQLLKESNKPESLLFKKVKGLYESITPSKGMEKALAVVLRPYTQTLVVETKEDLDAVIRYAQEHKLKDYSIVCMEQLQERKNTLTQGTSLLSRIKETILSRYFLKNVYLVSNPIEAIQLFHEADGVEVWTEDGAYVDSRGVLFFSSEGENNVFIREAELKTLDQKLQEMEKEQHVLERDWESLTQRKEAQQKKKGECEKELRKDEMKLVEANFALQRHKSDLEKMQKERENLDEELASIGTATDTLQEMIAQLKQKHVEAKAKAEAIKERESSLTEELNKQLDALQIQQNDLKVIEPDYQKAVEEQRKLNHILSVLEVKDLESQQQEKRLQEEIQRMQEQQNQIQNSNSDFEQVLQDVETDLKAVLEETREFEGQVGKRREVIEEIEQKIAEHRNALKEVESSQHQFGIQLAQFESNLESLENELQERYHLTIQEVKGKEYTLEETIEKTERTIRSLRRKIEEAGDINMTSIEEFDKHKSRYEFLSQQIDDLEASKTELVEIITQLDVESRKIFEETFAQIRENFRKNFEVLFNGGEADLKFTEAADILEAGVEIVAKPPGKQMRSISLLSGGEKCLTAVALLFAIFEVKPAPFCILDEIDAPLDDANVDRFLNVVKKFIDRCQFIIITHNKRTMSLADILFGVSMQEKGVSRLLSIEFSKEKSPEPALV